jgi:hypothetical protein
LLMWLWWVLLASACAVKLGSHLDYALIMAARHDGDV